MFLGAVWLLAVAAAAREVSGYDADLCEANVAIYNGNKIPIEDAPYIAALKYDTPITTFDFICTASIIHERFLLSATGCFDPKMKSNLPIYASMGSERFQNTSTNTMIEIDKVLSYEHYELGKVVNDICLVKLKKPVPFSKKIAKIELPEKNLELKPGTMLKVSGWGMTETQNKMTLDLRQTTVPVLSHKCCHETDDTIDDDVICAGVKGSGPCLGDGASPLVYNNTVVGLTLGAARNVDMCGGGVDVYTRVNGYLDWINITIANNL